MLHQRGGLVYHQMMMIQKRLSFFTAHNNLFVTFCGRFVLLNAHQMTLAYLFHDLKESSFCNQFDFNSFRINAKKSIPHPQLFTALATKEFKAFFMFIFWKKCPKWCQIKFQVNSFFFFARMWLVFSP